MCGMFDDDYLSIVVKKLFNNLKDKGECCEQFQI